MAVNLSKGGRVSLSKEAPGLSKILVGLGWDTNSSDTGAEFDLDASAFLLGASGKVENEKNFVFYNNLTSADGSVVHTGDNRTGEGEGDDEAIKIDLSKISPNVKEIDIVVTIHEAVARRQNFGMVRNSFMRIVDERSGKEIARYDLEEDFSTETAVSFGKIYFKDNEWRFAANGSGFKDGLAGFCRQFGLDVYEQAMAINLVKGQKISLAKDDGGHLHSFCVGANWGAITEKGFFRDKIKPVDLDLSAAMFDPNKQFCDVVYFGKKSAPGVFHSGDDLVGDVGGDDGLDNEIISVDLSRLNSNVEQIFFVLNSYNQIDFDKIPFASIRLYEGTPTRVNKVFASYNIVRDSAFAYKVAMILGKLYKRNGEWKFSAIGEPTSDRKLDELILNSVVKYL